MSKIWERNLDHEEKTIAFIEQYEPVYLYDRTRAKGWDKPLYNRVIFYNILTKVFNYEGVRASEILKIDHSTGLYYEKKVYFVLRQYEKEMLEQAYNELFTAYTQYLMKIHKEESENE